MKSGRSSLLHRTLRHYILLIMAPMLLLLSFLVVLTVRSNMNAQMEDGFAMLNIMAESIDRNVQLTENIIDSLAGDPDLQDFLSNTRQSPYTRAIKELYSLRSLISRAKYSLNVLNADVVVFSLSPHVPESYWYFLSGDRLSEMPDYQRFAGSERSEGWSGLGMLYPSSIVLNPDDNRLAFSYYCQVITGVGRVQGVIKCGVAPSGLFATVSAEELEGEVFVLEGTRPVYGNIRDEGVLSQLDPQRRSQIVRGRLFLRHDLEALNVSLMMSMDYSSLISKALVNGLPFLLAGIGSCALLYIMVRSFANAVQHRLNEVVEVAEQAKMGHLHVFLPNAKDDELGQLVDSFNALLSQLEQKAQAQIEHEKSEKRALQLALQYQMNPHFLFNTLNWLQMSMEMEEDREKLSNAIVQLGRLLRYNLNSDLLAPLQEEIENTRVYVHLMNLRKHDLIDLSVQMQAFDSRLRVIRFLLQPLCENAIQHGLIPGTPLHITIRGSLQEDLLCLHVINDGTKIEPERLSALQASMAEGRSGNGIGLANIATRLRLYYGDHASIQIASEDRETRVTLTIQMKQEEMADAAADCR